MTDDVENEAEIAAGAHPTAGWVAVVPLSFESQPAVPNFRQMGVFALATEATPAVHCGIVVEIGPEVPGRAEEPYTLGDKVWFLGQSAVPIGNRVFLGVNTPICYKREDEV